MHLRKDAKAKEDEKTFRFDELKIYRNGKTRRSHVLDGDISCVVKEKLLKLPPTPLHNGEVPFQSVSCFEFMLQRNPLVVHEPKIVLRFEAANTSLESEALYFEISFSLHEGTLFWTCVGETMCSDCEGIQTAFPNNFWLVMKLPITLRFVTVRTLRRIRTFYARAFPVLHSLYTIFTVVWTLRLLLHAFPEVQALLSSFAGRFLFPWMFASWRYVNSCISFFLPVALFEPLMLVFSKLIALVRDSPLGLVVSSIFGVLSYMGNGVGFVLQSLATYAGGGLLGVVKALRDSPVGSLASSCYTFLYWVGSSLWHVVSTYTLPKTQTSVLSACLTKIPQRVDASVLKRAKEILDGAASPLKASSPSSKVVLTRDDDKYESLASTNNIKKKIKFT